MKKKSDNILQFKVTLKGIRPPIWRRILIEENITFARFSHIINYAMGWNGGHLHSFYLKTGLGNGEVEITDAETAKEFWGQAPLVEDKVKVSASLFLISKKCKYTYDYGDDWEHTVTLEKILPRDPDMEYPACIKGKRACPPDDVGGVWGYQEFLEIIKDPEHPEHEETLEWVGGEFDPDYFDPEETLL